MSARPGAVGRSPIEVVAVPLIIVALAASGLVWGAGVVVSSLLGSTLPGSGGEGVAAILASFPDVGAAWGPAIPSLFVWEVAITVTGLLVPMIWKLMRSGNLNDGGARWATTSDLRRAGLLVPEGTPPHSIPEGPADAD